MKMLYLLRSIFFSFLTFTALMHTVNASIETYSFETAQQEKDYNVLIDELRCLVCQNQNLADSNAELAQDLRRQVHTMLVTEKKDKDSVVEFMVERYGDFVLYNPPVKSQTLLLWAGPFIFLLLGIGFLMRIVKQSNNIQPLKNEEAEHFTSKSE
ncbi:cytochrome c-type biogenesis protein [Thiomicrorhabdus lithotrophica]|uniref:Cytochrome c-type biogenesis protein n=1 Tax=Thiomicrorhabdus lithotrophica TaxID=2949997 RepID=A0ABY8CC18_9GAMM|nr:cytochrome c-type biogenesis protein [Thiomicrorhabdus lithotrophica]WEJ62220.1 cytochrome c-type biogenesis protein CcmH [Thiomicrorhabdus lithotrophica]